MAFLQISHVEIKGISACVPKRIERNRDYPYLSADEIEKYIATIGVVLFMMVRSVHPICVLNLRRSY